jgi:hypothetical protein
MANGDGNNNNNNSNVDALRQQQIEVARAEGAAQRAADQAQRRLEATRDVAAAEGRVLDALNANIEIQKRALEFNIENNRLDDEKIESGRKYLRVLEAQQEVIKDTTATADKLVGKVKSLLQIPDTGAADYFDNLSVAVGGYFSELSKTDEEQRGFFDRIRDGYESAKSSVNNFTSKIQNLTAAMDEDASALDRMRAGFNLFRSQVEENDDAAQSFLAGINKVALGLQALGRTMITISATGLQMMVKQSISMAVSADRVTAAFTAQTGVVGPLRQGIVSLSRENLNLGVSFEDASKASTSLLTGFGDFIALSPTVQGNLKQSAVELQKIGLSTDTFASSLSELNNSFGLTPMMAEDTIKSLSALGIELGVGADKINQDFVASLPRLRVYGDSAVDVFEELAIAARAAGTSVSSLTGLLGEQFDTFEGSARIAGRLNAVLGTDMFSSTELLLANEAERLEILRERLAMSGVEFSNLSKFQQKALAAAAGINDVNEAAKIFGNTQAAVAMQVGDLTLTQEELNERIQQGRDVSDKLKFALASLAVFFEPFAEGLAIIAEKLVEFTEYMGDKGVGAAILLAKVGLLGFGLLMVKTSMLFQAGAQKVGAYTTMIHANTQALLANAAAQAAAGGGVGPIPGGLGRTPGGGQYRPDGTVTTISSGGGGGSDGGGRRGGGGGARTGPKLAGAGRAVGGSIVAMLLSFFIKPIVETIAKFFGVGDSAASRIGSGASGAASGASMGLMLAAVLAPFTGGLSLGAMAAVGGVSALAGGAASYMASAQEGGITTEDGVMQVHKQEAIVPLDMFTNKLDELIDAVKVKSPSGDGNIVVKVMLNERELGEAIKPIIDRRVLGR